MTKTRAFLWLIREATEEQVERVTRLLRAEPNRTWSEIVEKNLAEYLKIAAG